MSGNGGDSVEGEIRIPFYERTHSLTRYCFSCALEELSFQADEPGAIGGSGSGNHEIHWLVGGGFCGSTCSTVMVS